MVCTLWSRVAAVLILTAATAGTWVCAVQPAHAAPSPRPHREVSPEVHHDTSPPLRSIRPVTGSRRHRAIPLRTFPRPPAGVLPDPVVQPPAQPRPGERLAPTVTRKITGVGAGFSGPQGSYTVSTAPADPNLAVGATQVVDLVNTAFAVLSKTGTVQYGPADTNTLWSGFGGHCQTDNFGDATVRYDNLANRWVITQFANVSSSGPYYECLAVSKTSDATGAYNRYAFQYANFPDYPKLSVWPDAYYITYNLYSGTSGGFQGTEACAYDRTRMLNGVAATQQCFITPAPAFASMLAADLDGTTPPPTGEPNTLVALGGLSSLEYWKFHVDWANTANTTFTGPTNLIVAPYVQPCLLNEFCVPQPGTSQGLDVIADRLMYRLAYRNFGNHESLVVSHTVTSLLTTGIRWYELRRDTAGTVSVFQQGTWAPDATNRWMGSIAMDKAGNMALGYSGSSASMFPSVLFTGRLAGDAAGQMTQGEGTIQAGSGSQIGTDADRWGDYSSMSVDPTDGCTFWYTHEYLAANGADNWSTKLGAFQLPGCVPSLPANDFSISASPSSATVSIGSQATTAVKTAVTSGSAQTIALSVSGLPPQATASFNPASVTAGGSPTVTISTSALTPAGTYPISIAGTGTSAAHTTTYSLTVTPHAGIINGGFETGNLSGWTGRGPITGITTTGPHTGHYSAQLGSAVTPTQGDSSIAQTFAAPTGSRTLSFWYNIACPDTVSYDWATATLTDNTAHTTATVLSQVCTNDNTWRSVRSAITPGHSYTLTLISHDDNYSADPTATKYDDVGIS